LGSENSRDITTVLGAGAWGSTISDLLERKGLAVRVWDKSHEALDRLATEGHPFGVPELEIPNGVRLEADLSEAIRGASVIVFVVPSQAVRSVARQLSDLLNDGEQGPLLVLACKGLDLSGPVALSEVLEQERPTCRYGVLSGPCIAREVAQRIPTSVVSAARDPSDAVRIRDLFVARHLRVYTQSDMLGVELGGALKNIIAIAAGIGDGLGFGANTKSALMTRGLAELTRLATSLGAELKTLFGLAGLGDLAVTCFSPHSRNRTFGECLGKGLSADEAADQIGMVVEGVPTARAALKIAKEKVLDLPIAEAVVRVTDGDWTPREAVENLMQRELREEFGPRAAT
jgi:glycerol-3-phosphate dehydrogenase (NAD(P)+)